MLSLLFRLFYSKIGLVSFNNPSKRHFQLVFSQQWKWFINDSQIALLLASSFEFQKLLTTLQSPVPLINHFDRKFFNRFAVAIFFSSLFFHHLPKIQCIEKWHQVLLSFFLVASSVGFPPKVTLLELSWSSLETLEFPKKLQPHGPFNLLKVLPWNN